MESLLPRCLDSLVSPICSDLLEILVINDGSKDNSFAIARQYEDNYPGIIQAIDKPNGNYGSAVNKGIELATAKYLKILDADDFYDNSGLQELVKKLTSLEVDMVMTNFRRDREKEKRYYSSPISMYNKILDFRDVDITKFQNFKMHAITYKTSILKNNNITLQTGISYTDSEFCFYPLPYIKSFIALDILVYCYQLGRIGQTVDISSLLKSTDSMAQIIRRMHDYLLENKIDKYVLDKLVVVFCDICSLYFLTILCFDKSNNKLATLSDLLSYVKRIDGAHEKLLNSNLFGVRYYKRFTILGKPANNSFYSLYYKLVKSLASLYHRIKL